MMGSGGSEVPDDPAGRPGERPLEGKRVVSIIIAAHDRPRELQRTLRELSFQTYRPLEVIVVDDGSPEPLEPLVRGEWPDAQIIRHNRSVGAHRSRSEAMAQASGDFILTLDDDSSPCQADAIQRAVD